MLSGEASFSRSSSSAIVIWTSPCEGHIQESTSIHKTKHTLSLQINTLDSKEKGSSLLNLKSEDPFCYKCLPSRSTCTDYQEYIKVYDCTLVTTDSTVCVPGYVLLSEYCMHCTIVDLRDFVCSYM
eukprot:scpid47667/ scgid33364/ 